MINFTSIKLYKDEQLRDYQLENKLKIYEHLEVHHSVMLQMPTGTGKTRLFASIVKDIHNLSIKDKKAYKVLILAHRNELIKQISENVGVQYGIAHGKIMSKNWEEDYYPTQVASVQTLIRRLDKWGDKKFDFIIIDEAHHALAPTYVKICDEFPDAKVLGVTATPYRMSKSSFRSMFDELIVSESISEFIKKGYLSEYEYYSIKPSSKIQNLVDNISEFDFDGDYAEKALSNTFDKDKIRANLLDTYFKYAEGKKGIIYTINKRHNEHVCNMFIDAGIIAKAIDSDTNHEERSRIVKDFKNGNIQILCNVNIFSEGFDCPDVEFIQLARPTKSLSMYLQQVGRGFRIHEDKEKVIFLDNVGLFNRFGLPSANRKWLKHFNGSKDTEDYSQNNNNNENVRFIEIDIEEGNEEIELIFSSNINELNHHIENIKSISKLTTFDNYIDSFIVLIKEFGFDYIIINLPKGGREIGAFITQNESLNNASILDKIFSGLDLKEIEVFIKILLNNNSIFRNEIVRILLRKNKSEIQNLLEKIEYDIFNCDLNEINSKNINNLIELFGIDIVKNRLSNTVDFHQRLWNIKSTDSTTFEFATKIKLFDDINKIIDLIINIDSNSKEKYLFIKILFEEVFMQKTERIKLIEAISKTNNKQIYLTGYVYLIIYRLEWLDKLYNKYPKLNKNYIKLFISKNKNLSKIIHHLEVKF